MKLWIGSCRLEGWNGGLGSRGFEMRFVVCADVLDDDQTQRS